MNESSKFTLVIRSDANETEPCLTAMYCATCQFSSECSNEVKAMDLYHLMEKPIYATKLNYKCNNGKTFFNNGTYRVNEQMTECLWNTTWTDLQVPLSCISKQTFRIL